MTNIKYKKAELEEQTGKLILYVALLIAAAIGIVLLIGKFTG